MYFVVLHIGEKCQKNILQANMYSNIIIGQYFTKKKKSLAGLFLKNT
jgi:hypothetical protein